MTDSRYGFSGHQTFPFRYTWLPKGVQAVHRDPGLYWHDDAVVKLGVGKNMVLSIRFWCDALGLTRSDGKKKNAHPTELGTELFGDDGWDPYLEDPATLWLLHWQLVQTPDVASTWHLAFTRWARKVFTRAQLVDWLEEIAARSGDKRTSRASLKRDVDVFVRTYLPPSGDRRRALEDSFDCPLTELGLIREVGDGVYQFHVGPQPTLPPEIFAYALMNFWMREAPDQETLSFERVAYGSGSPGGAFKLSESACVTLLENLPVATGIQYDETAGLRVLFRATSDVPPLAILRQYYRDRSQQARVA